MTVDAALVVVHNSEVAEEEVSSPHLDWKTVKSAVVEVAGQNREVVRAYC